MKRFCEKRVLPLLFVFAFLSCDKDQGSRCKLDLGFSSEYSFPAMKQLKETLLLKGVTEELPDTNSFILSIVDSGDKSIYYGAYKDRPEEIVLDEGGYTVSVVSKEQTEPLFNTPQYGDSHVIFLQEGENLRVNFLCKHVNSGIKINYSNEFKQKFPSHATFIKSGDYILEYPYSEHRIAYFSPARVELLMKKDSEQILFSRDIDAGKVLTVNITTSSESDSEELNIVVDTSKLWETQDVSWGDNNDGNIEAKALTVSEAKKWVGAKDVWIRGYIVGGDLTSSNVKFKTPFTKLTNLAISDNKNETNRENCISVELKSDKVRDALNLVTNPSNLNKLVLIQGAVTEPYFGLIGVKNVRDFRIN